MKTAALGAAGRVEASYATWLQALDETPSSDASGRVRVIAACAATENMLGRHEQARRRLLDAREARLPNTTEAVLVELELATYGVFMNEPKLICDSAQRNLLKSLACRFGVPPSGGCFFLRSQDCKSIG